MRVADVVRDEIERVGGDLPVREESGDEVVHRQIGILVDDFAHRAEVPTVNPIEWERRQIERFLRRDDEEVSHPGRVFDPPFGGPWEEKSEVSASQDERVRIRVLREQERHHSVGVDAEDRYIGRLGCPVVDPHSVPPIEHRFIAAIDPDTSFQLIVVRQVLGASLARHPAQGERQQRNSAHSVSQIL